MLQGQVTKLVNVMRMIAGIDGFANVSWKVPKMMERWLQYRDCSTGGGQQRRSHDHRPL